MTHPDIEKIEHTGYLHEEKSVKLLGNCECCDCLVFDNNGLACKSPDGIFCCEDCCHEYYEIQSLE